MNFKEKVFEYIGKYPCDGTVLVFPYENVARSYENAYVRETGKAVFSDALISWDTFCDRFTSVPEGAIKAQYTDRCLFVSDLFDKGGFRKLRYYADSRYSCARSAYIRSIASAIPDMCRAFDLSSMQLLSRVSELAPPDMIHDLKLIVPEYKAFLESHGMYEKALLESDFSGAGNYVIALPQCITDSRIDSACLFCHVLSYDGVPDKSCVNAFGIAPNALTEIRECIRNIHGKLTEGALLCDFAITCGDLESYRPYLELEAGRRDIKLKFLSARSLTEYAPGRFFIVLRNLKESFWSISAMKDLLLDPQFPFSDRAFTAKIIEAAVDLKIQEGSPDFWLKKISGYGNAALSEGFAKLMAGISAITDCTDPGKLRENVMVFIKTFFGEQSWTDRHSSRDAMVFGSCEEELNTLYRHASAFGIGKHGDLFNLFTDILRDKVYQPNDGSPGIPVYRYPMSAGIAVKNHYVIGLSEANTGKERNPYPFLKDECPDVIRLSDGILDIYQQGIGYGGCRMSGCDESYSGAVILPTRFLSGDDVVRISPSEDSLKTEENIWRCNAEPGSLHSMTKAQKESFLTACDSTLKFSAENVFPQVALPFRTGVSSTKDFEECPYKGYIRYILRLKEHDFQPKPDNPSEIGEILHKTFQKALTEAGRLEKIHEDRLKRIFRQNVVEYSKRADATDKNHISRIIMGYEDKLYDVVEGAGASYLSSLDFAGKEEATGSRIQMYNIMFTGRADCVLVSDEGDFSVIDFKKSGDKYYNRADIGGISLQLAIYARMLEANPRYGKTPEKGAYYSVSDGKYLFVWPPLKISPRSKFTYGFPYEEVEKNCDERVHALSEMIETGSFNPTPSKNACEYCTLKTLCRGGFEIR